MEGGPHWVSKKLAKNSDSKYRPGAKQKLDPTLARANGKRLSVGLGLTVNYHLRLYPPKCSVHPLEQAGSRNLLLSSYEYILSSYGLMGVDITPVACRLV